MPRPGCVTAAIRNTVETASEKRARTGIRFQSKPAKTPKMIARASTLAPTIGPDGGFRNPLAAGSVQLHPREQRLGVAVVPTLDPERDVAALEAIELPVARQHRLHAGVAQLVAECQRRLDVLEVAHHDPV